ncbi:MAG: VTT domain-containing protein [Flavobacteriales bacterium]
MIFQDLIDLLTNLKPTMEGWIMEYQTTTYFILALIIFCETGLIALPILPGDSLLFTAGLLCKSLGVLNIWVLIPLLFGAAILGDNVNYFVGKFFGEKVFEIKWLKRFIKREYLDKTHLFFEKHGGKTIIMARFVPIVRTFAPFAAGIGQMNYVKYITFCIVGGIAWVSGLTLLGYFLAENEFINVNYEKVIMGIIAISVLPIVFSFLKSKFSKSDK